MTLDEIVAHKFSRERDETRIQAVVRPPARTVIDDIMATHMSATATSR
jgi:hypothetical protein